MACHDTTTDTTIHPCPNHLVHQHTFPELAISSNGDGSNQQTYFRAMIFFNKKPGLTDEFFHEHWKSVHADLTMQVDGAGVDLVRYVQFHQEKKHIESLLPLMEASNGTMKMVEWDGAAEFHAKSADKFIAFMKSVYGAKQLVGCGTRFVDMVKGYQVMAGYDNLIMGSAIPGQGKDGISVKDGRLTAKRKAEDEVEEEDAPSKKVCVEDEASCDKSCAEGKEEAEEEEVDRVACEKLCVGAP